MESWYSFSASGNIDEDRIIRTISPDKDVDGFHPVNVDSSGSERPICILHTGGIIQL